ncbi:MAG: sugar nucleotide-binding protein [Candidatus Korobacteraceae bacterium]
MSRVNVTILGGSGMLGSMVADVLSRDPDLKVSATVRSGMLADHFAQSLPEVDWRVFEAASAERYAILGAIKGAHWIINAIGITKPYAHDDNPVEVENAIRLNSLFPYELAACALTSGAKVLQIATDCVYSGHRGSYSETDVHDPLDVYGKTKSLGEVLYPGTNCLRCSIIGPEPKSYVFLIEWFRRQPHGAVLNGFINHQWNGVTTLHFARLCIGAIKSGIPLSRLQHVIPSGSLSKHDLLRTFVAHFQRPDIRISPTEAKTVVDRTLSTKYEDVNRNLWVQAGYGEPPTIPAMIAELANFDYRFGTAIP